MNARSDVPLARSGFGRPSRRGVLAGTAGLTLGFVLGLPAADGTAASSDGVINAYVRIAPDGKVTIFAPVPEMGQATNTAIPLIIAEELDADWSKVSVETAPVAEPYNHPLFRTQLVLGSLSTRSYWMPARTAGAQARRVLIEAAARRWNVAPAELTTEPGIVVHAASGRRLSYGEIASFAAPPAQLPEIKPADLKAISDFRLIGKDVARWDVPAKATGAATYAIDVQVPGMVYATLARAPVLGSRAQSHNGEELRQRPGILAVMPLAGGVAIVGERIEAVLAARQAIRVEWTTAPGSSFDSTTGLQTFLTHVRDTARKGDFARKSGEAEQAIASSAKVASGEYTTDHVYHAQLEPLTCVASVTEGGVEIWAGTQWPTKVRDEAAKITGVAPDRVKVHMPPMGGSFGRRMQFEYVTEAVEIAKAIKRPVKLMATREDDVANAHCRPMTAHRIDVGLDPAGKILGWRHRIAADLVVPQLYGQARLDAQKGMDHIVMAHADVAFYDVPAHLAEHVYEDSGLRTGAWRGVGAGHNVFAIEAMIDDLARAAGQDPLAYRLALLKDARGKAVVQAVAGMAEWPRKREGTALGLAFSRLGTPQVGESLAAVVVETALDREKGLITVKRIWCAVDVGLPVQPRNIVQQVEGALLWGVSSALIERMSFKGGAVEQQNYYDYEVLRMSATPEISVQIVGGGDTPLPVGELGLAAVMPAVSNAALALTGKRLHNAPFTPERVKRALSA